MTVRRRWLTLALALTACAAPAGVGPSATVSPSATTTTPVVALPSATVTPAATTAPPPSPTATATPAPTATPVAAYCAVADVPTPTLAFADHARTYLDWTYALPQTYVPPDLVDAVTGSSAVPTPFAVEAVGAAEVLARLGDPAYSTLLADAPGVTIRKIAFSDLAALRSAASADGVKLVLLSTYRSYSLQVATFDYWVRIGGYAQALRTSARPGHSEHQLGTVIDFGDGSAAPWEYLDWATTPSGSWLARHAAEFGFVMSFPRGATAVTCYDYEPWHYRWVGRTVAAEVTSAAVPLRVFQSNLR
jgi:D-alanyl-D-alanine carboxypeptidase